MLCSCVDSSRPGCGETSRALSHTEFMPAELRNTCRNMTPSTVIPLSFSLCFDSHVYVIINAVMTMGLGNKHNDIKSPNRETFIGQSMCCTKQTKQRVEGVFVNELL